MPAYRPWNRALAGYFAKGLPPGEPFYLSVDDDALLAVGAEWFGGENPPETGATEATGEAGAADYAADFLRAVRQQCVAGGGISLDSISGRPEDGPPDCIGLLAAMVLAAYRMAPDEDAAEINYFTRLREVLGLDLNEPGRPAGLRYPANASAPEEQLWAAFNHWVLRNGWLPSAGRGPEGPQKYTNYPLSQTLLRRADKEHLERLFRDAGIHYQDEGQIAVWFLREGPGLPSFQLRELAKDAPQATPERFNAIIGAVFEVASSIDWNAPAGSGLAALWTQRRLTAGLYRDANPLTDTAEYLLYPRKPQRWESESLSVKRDGQSTPLRNERPRYFRPLPGPVNPAGGQTFPVTGHPHITELVLPARDFWALTRDPQDETSGVFASWGRPRLGETFLLLARQECAAPLNLLQEEGGLDWEGGPVELPEPYAGWLEYRECRVVSPNWDGIMARDFDELRPHTRASISLPGGLKTGQRDTWIAGYLPEVYLASFDPVGLSVRVVEVSQPDLPILDEGIEANRAVALPPLTPGDYAIEALSSGRIADRRRLSVAAWENLESADPSEPFGTPIGAYTLQGAMLYAAGAPAESEG